MRLDIDTYENNDSSPIITHTFYGRTAVEIQSVIDAHKKTDSFFRAAMTTKRFGNIKLRNVMRWTR